MYKIKSLPKSKRRGFRPREIEQIADTVLKAVNDNDIDLMLYLKYKEPITYYTWIEGINKYSYHSYMGEAGYETWLKRQTDNSIHWSLPDSNFKMDVAPSAYGIRTLFKRLGIKVEEVF